MIKSKAAAKAGGFTLLEVLVVLAITAMLAMVVSTTLIQLLVESDRSASQLTSSQQVQNAGFWFKRDGVMAQTIDTTDNGGTPEFELLTLTWIDWDNKLHEAVYTLQDSGGGLKKLERSYSIDAGPTQTTYVAESIIGASTSITWDGDILTLNIASQIGNQNEARTYQVKPRPLV